MGGAKSVRGVLRDRVVGKSMAWGNLEFRWKFARFNLGNQNVYLALSPFLDLGRVVQKYDLDLSGVDSSVRSNYFSGKEEGFHFTAGCGFHAALNENFVVAFDYGMALNRQDGKKGVYIGINWLF